MIKERMVLRRAELWYCSNEGDPCVDGTLIQRRDHYWVIDYFLGTCPDYEEGVDDPHPRVIEHIIKRKSKK